MFRGEQLNFQGVRAMVGWKLEVPGNNFLKDVCVCVFSFNPSSYNHGSRTNMRDIWKVTTFLGGDPSFFFYWTMINGRKVQSMTGLIFFWSDAISSEKFLSGGIPWGYSFLVKTTGGGKEKSDNPTIESQNDIISIGLVEFGVPNNVRCGYPVMMAMFCNSYRSNG